MGINFKKFNVMNQIKKIFRLLLFTVALGFGLSSCTVDEPIVVVPKTIDQYIAQFSEYVASERAFVDNCVVGYNKGDFAPLSASSFDSYTAAYRAALQADSAVIVKPGVTIAELVAANTSLAVPGKAFWGKINISDRRPLNDLITEVTALSDNTAVGTAVGQVSQEAKNALATAIAAAIATRDASTTIDRQVTEGVTALNTAKQAFLNAVDK